VRSRIAALALGPLLHVLGDRMPHQDNASRRFEIAGGAMLVAAIAAARGPTDPAVVGALAASAPDVEHLVRLPRPGGRKLFPSHRFSGWHRPGGMPAWAQVLAAGALVGGVIATGRMPRGASP
jgi:hypothetical protein